jgi:hypothetical protein
MYEIKSLGGVPLYRNEEASTLTGALEAAVKTRADLRGAYLRQEHFKAAPTS